MKIAAFLIIIGLSFSAFKTVAQDANRVEFLLVELELASKGKLPYGFKPGTEFKKLKKKMGEVELFLEDGNYITYTVYFDETKRTFGDISFDFKNESLVSSTVETYFDNKSATAKAFELIKQEFVNSYGNPSFQEGKLKWKFIKKHNSLEMQMWKIENEGDQGFIVEYVVSEL